MNTDRIYERIVDNKYVSGGVETILRTGVLALHFGLKPFKWLGVVSCTIFYGVLDGSEGIKDYYKNLRDGTLEGHRGHRSATLTTYMAGIVAAAMGAVVIFATKAPTKANKTEDVVKHDKAIVSQISAEELSLLERRLEKDSGFKRLAQLEQKNTSTPPGRQ